MRYDDKWDNILCPILQGTEYELVGVVKSGDGGRSLLRVYLDKPGGITIDEIAKLSREIDMVLSVELEMARYTLEVSSPGLNRLLFKPAHFQQHVGKEIKLKLGPLHDNRRHFVGVLTAATEEAATVLFESEECVFSYTDIEEARLVVDITLGKGKGKKGEAHDEQ